MKVSAISSAYTARQKNNTNFKGHWETRIAKWEYLSESPLHEIKNYVTDSKDTNKDIINAWKEETGETPFNWAQKNNMYAPMKGGVQYRLNNSPYLPIDLLKDSVELEYKQLNKRDAGSRLKADVHKAWLEGQDKNPKGVKKQEKNMKTDFDNEIIERNKDINKFILNVYKEKLGSKLFYEI